jgi:hypothetical protein
MCDIFQTLFDIRNLNEELVEFDTGEDFSYQSMEKEDLLVYIGKLRAEHKTLLKKLYFLETFLQEIIGEVKQTEEYKKRMEEERLKSEILKKQFETEEIILKPEIIEL